jgi:hypothetical protein
LPYFFLSWTGGQRLAFLRMVARQRPFSGRFFSHGSNRREKKVIIPAKEFAAGGTKKDLEKHRRMR